MREHFDHIRELAKLDGRYAPEAFIFVSEAISHTANWLRQGVIPPQDSGESRGEHDEFHVSGQELLMGIHKLAKERWGAMTVSIFHSWGLHKTEDFGEIVFCMIRDEKMNWKKRECDTIEDFANGYDFETAFNDLD